MKTILFNILFIFAANFCFSQIDNDAIKNAIDSIGLKQGYWVEFEAHPTVTYIGDDFNVYDYKKLSILRYEGSYLNGLRTGEWLVYSPKGNKIYLVTYLNGTLEGKFERYYHDKTRNRGIIERKKDVVLEVLNEDGSRDRLLTFPTRDIVRDFFE